MGDPAGIGPEIALAAAADRRVTAVCEPVLYGPLAAVERAAREGTNLVPPIIAAVEALATVGEISDTLRGVFGEYRAAGS